MSYIQLRVVQVALLRDAQTNLVKLHHLPSPSRQSPLTSNRPTPLTKLSSAPTTGRKLPHPRYSRCRPHDPGAWLAPDCC